MKEKPRPPEPRRRRLRREKDNPFSLSEMPDRKTLEDFLKGIFYSSDTVYNAARGKFEKRSK